jgi:hypothetical protein
MSRNRNERFGAISCYYQAGQIEIVKDERLREAAEALTGQGDAAQSISVCDEILEYLGQEFGRKVRGDVDIRRHCYDSWETPGSCRQVL